MGFENLVASGGGGGGMDFPLLLTGLSDYNYVCFPGVLAIPAAKESAQ